MDPATIAMLAQVASQVLGGGAPPPPQTTPGGMFNLDPTSGDFTVDTKFTEKVQKHDQPEFRPLTGNQGAPVASMREGFLEKAIPKGAPGGAEKPKAGGGADSMLQMAALAAQVGSMFAPPPPPSPPGAGGGGSFNPQPTSQHSLRSIYGR